LEPATERERLLLSFGEALTQISRRLTGSADRDAIARICDNRREEKAVMFSEVDDDVASMVAALCAQGHRLAVVSNCFAEDVAAWSTWRPARHFMTTVFSFEIGAAKPDPAIYLEAMRRLGADEQSAVSSSRYWQTGGPCSSGSNAFPGPADASRS